MSKVAIELASEKYDKPAVKAKAKASPKAKKGKKK